MPMILNCSASTSTTVQCFVSCVKCIDARMSSNRMKMNADKTPLLWRGTRQQLNKLSMSELQLLGHRSLPLWVREMSNSR